MRPALKKTAAFSFAATPLALVVVIGFIALATPLRPSGASPWVPVATLSGLPVDGRPQCVSIRVPHCDAWTRLPDRTIDWIYVRRSPTSGAATALHTRHKMGTFVEYDEPLNCFRNTCFIVRFDLDGKELPDNRIRPEDYEDMRTLNTRVENDVVFVRYEGLSFR
jgi:hypothetical protein